jgi:hypothetical protein
MPKGVRRPEEIAGLGLGNRLMVRIGALLKKKLAVSPLVLEGARPGTPVETFLLDAALLEQSASLTAKSLQALSAKTPGVNAAFALTTADDGMNVLCLQDELEAGDWAVSTATPPTASAPASAALAVAPANTGHAAGGESLFSRAEIDRWRLKLSAAANANERIEALRTLSLAPLTPPEKADVLLQGLSDRDYLVRSEAANLLPSVGGDRDIADALSSLNHSDPARRNAAIDRLLKLTGGEARDIDVGAVAVCVITTLKTESDEKLMARLLDVLKACAPALGRNPARLAEVVRILLGMVSTAAKHGSSSRELEQVLGPAHRLLAALGSAVPQDLGPVLFAERERASDPVCEALLLQLLLDLTPPNSGREDELVNLSCAYLARDREEGRDSRAVGTRLLRRGEKAFLALCDIFSQATTGAQKYSLLLLDDICRLNKPSPQALERGAAILLHCIENGSKGLSMSAMQCRFGADPSVSEATRSKLAERFLGAVSDFVFPFDIERVESTIAQMDLAAIEPLVRRLSADTPAPDRIRAVRLLGNISTKLKVPKGEIARTQDAVTAALRRVQALSLDPKFPDRGELLCTLGKLSSTVAASKEAGVVIERTLLEAAGGKDLKLSARALEGLTYLASSRRAQGELVAGTFVLLKRRLDEMVLDISTDAKRINGETVIEITGGESYVDILPIILQGLGRVGASPNCPPMIMRDIGRLLMDKWRQICTAELVWGPANTLLVIQAIRELACQKQFPADQRAEVLKSFAPRLMQSSIMHAVTEILAADDSTTSGPNALTFGQAILSRRGRDGLFAAEDREEILAALARIAARKYLGASADIEKARTFRRMVLEELFKGLRDLVPECYEALVRLREMGHLPQDQRDEIERRLRDYHSIVLK